MGFYHTAQICLNGHIITNYFDKYSEFRSDFCRDCGQPTITNCPKCNDPIKGGYSEGYSIHNDPAPAYCHKCGNPYPWTESRLKAAIELIQEEESLGSDDKLKISDSLTDVICETPKTALAATRVKKAIDKMSSIGKEGFKQIIIEIASETAKRLIWPNP